jgi:hypothetical protein
MENRGCTTCAYAWWNAGQWLASLPLGFPQRPVCANHPDTPGLMTAVPPGGPCRNYRAKSTVPGGDVRQISLGAGQYAYVDAADYEQLRRYRWSRCGSGYAGRREKGRLIFMHRQIMQTPKGRVVDHIDGNRTNNCRANMRNCTDMQNRRNQAKRIGCVCRFKGVYYRKRAGKYFSSVMFNGKVVWLGYFDDDAQAARAYDRKVAELFGEYAWLNFPEDWPATHQPPRGRLEVGKAEAKKARWQQGEVKR